MKKFHFLAALLVGSAACLSPAAAQTNPSERRSYDLPAQDLGDALRSAATVAGIELYASSRDLDGKSAPPLKGRLSVREAIEALLAGSGLVARFEAGAVIISDGSQTASPLAASEDEAIVVTGSRIAGAAPAAPLIRVTAEEIRRAGQNDLGEVARSLPQNFGGGQNPGIGNGQGAGNENANVNGASTFNLRGVGPNATLTLLNGNRFAYTGVSSVIDVSAIPVSAVERIEISADGASAIYGADAVAGVVNILLKRDYDGVSAMGRLGASTDGGNFQQQAGLLGGSVWASGGIMAAYDFSRSSTIRAGDRSYAAAANPGTTLFPAQRRHSLLISGHQALGENVTFTADMLYKRSRNHSVTAFTLGATPETSGFDAVSTSKIVGIAPGLAIELGGDWTFKTTGFFGTDRTGGATRLFAGGAELARIDRHFFNRNMAIEGGFQGPLFALPGGDVRLAIGGGARRNFFRSVTPTGTLARRRDNIFAYGEIHVPLAAPAQEISGLHRLALTGAVRFEDYSDAGGIVTPKLGLAWEPISILRFGVSWGRSFKMPTLAQQYSGYTAVLAPASRYGSGLPTTATVLYAAGPDSRIGPERSENWMLSAQLTPAEGLQLSLSWFDIDYRDRVATPFASSAGALDNPIFADSIVRSPGVSLLDEIIAGALPPFQNVTGAAYDPANVVAFLDLRDRNIARQRYRGVDLSLRYRFALGGGELSLSGAATLLRSRQRIRPDAPWTRLAGTLFHPARFRARGGVAWADDKVSVAAFVSHSGALEDARRAAAVQVRGLTTFDLNGEMRIASGTRLSLSALNLFNAKPAATFTASPAETPYDTTNYSPAGRFLGITLRTEW
ncbi:MAG: TonB-dependent receptor domain-containing protein [Sphingopyxis solisilvae]|uniref:TonB-dependent receptor domain-containing protein n=1 Tax=Sphingopyxis solisilvae TaxID=1886788 RepID=UPI0040367AED